MWVLVTIAAIGFIAYVISCMTKEKRLRENNLKDEITVTHISGLNSLKRGDNINIRISNIDEIILHYYLDYEDNYINIDPFNIIKCELKEIPGEKYKINQLSLSFIYENKKYDCIFTYAFSLDSLMVTINEIINNEIFGTQDTLDIDGELLQAIYYSGISKIGSMQNVFFWVWDGFVNIANKSIEIISIPVKDVVRYTIKGDMHNELHISGGDTQSAKFGDVVGGALFAGEAGAAVQLRGKNASIKTENIVIDSRKTILEAYIENKLCHIFFDSKAYEILLKEMPNKEISFTEKPNNANANVSIYEKIRQLAKLRDEGILTESEFKGKKAKLLEQV